jgi:hypothetical protein
MVSLDTVSDNIALPKALPVLWKKEITHAVVVGDGGMGKTVSLIHWWKKLLEAGEHQKEESIPVFIALNEYNQVPEGKREDFIIASILKNYGDDDRESFTAADVKKTMKTPLTKGSVIIPSIVLLLDGFNEITVEKKELLLELNHLVEQCSGIQVVITSRYDMRGNFNWGHWNLVRLQELEEEKVAEYLQSKGLAVLGPGRLRGLLGNPMMLTLYAASCEVQTYQKNSRYCCFKETVETPGELLWNFIEAQVAILPERVGPGENQVVYYWFLLKYLLPGLGYEMEKQGLFDFTNAQFQESLDRLCRRFAREDFFDTFPQFGKYEDMLPMGECADGRECRKRAARLRDIFCNELHVLVEEGQSLRFLHQDFRDFFAAVHLLNEAEISLNKGEIPGVFKERILDYFVRRLVGEIEGEHWCKSYLVKEDGWKININKENRLYKMLDLCRGKFGEEVGHTVWNIVTIWKEVRGELSGADLSGLDLSGIPFNGVWCSRFYEDHYLAAKFDDSRVHEKNLLPQGHSWMVNSAVYSPDGKRILSASFDQTIKEWDVGTGECVKTLAGHLGSVTSPVYSPDSKKILSASDDRTIKEWDAGTGECVKTLSGHTVMVWRAVYSLDRKKILSTTKDQTIKEWDATTGKCLKTHHKKGHPQISIYSPDEKSIKLNTDGNIIYVQDASGKGKKRELINIPGLFIQGCSFQNLEKGSEWSEEGLAILKQYHALL